MTLKARLFGRKVEGKLLRDLVEALGGNAEKILTQDKHKCLTPRKHKFFIDNKVYGRCTFNPVEEGIDADLYVFMKYFGLEGIRGSEEYIRVRDTIHLTGRIPYKMEEQK